MTNKFWFDDYKILFENLDEFYPTYEMDLVSKLNSITRLGLYIGIILTIITLNYFWHLLTRS